MKLECRLMEDWKYHDLKWSVPDEDTEGCVEDQESGKVLTVLDDKFVLEDKDEPLSDRQKWFRGVKDGDGWFSLKKPLTYTIPDEDTKNLTEETDEKEDQTEKIEDVNEDSKDSNESIDLTKSQKRDLFALQNYGAFRNMNMNTN